MNTQKVLYKSKGLSAKTEKRFKISVPILGIGGIVLLLMPTLMDASSAFAIAGVIYIVLALIMYKMEKKCKSVAIDYFGGSGSWNRSQQGSRK